MDGEYLYEFQKRFYPNNLGSAIIEYVEQLKADKKELEKKLKLYEDI